MAVWTRRHRRQAASGGESVEVTSQIEANERVEIAPTTCASDGGEPDQAGGIPAGDGVARVSRAAHILVTADEIEHRFTGEVISARKASDSLLDLWAVAHEFDPYAAQPAQQLLVALVGRNFVTPTELSSALDKTKVAVEFCLECGELMGPVAAPTSDDRSVNLRR